MSIETLYTPIISINTANANKLFLFCNVVNVSSQPRNGTIQILLAGGVPLTTTSFSPLPPGMGTGDGISQTPLPASTAFITLVYAKVTVEGGAKDIRAALILGDANGNTMVSAEAH